MCTETKMEKRSAKKRAGNDHLNEVFLVIYEYTANENFSAKLESILDISMFLKKMTPN